MLMDDRQLLVQTRDGHEPAARLLWERHAPRLLAYARAILPPRLSPDDVVQSVFCRVVALDRATIKGVADVAAWLTILARREALNAIRADRRERARLALRARREETPSTLGSRDDLQIALDSLPRRLREVVTLKHVSGLTFDQIALALALNRNTAAARYRAAIETLRRSLNDALAGPTPRANPMEVLHG